ncbi:protein-glutamine gamma-glutamyltransferase K-like [Anguilla rostrata]|uniref:protein-glutamine gamma-glutamyltransferase K-like n=1 Tax=Anguilla rostrata TaxID=7938 RepID=UPI0030D51B0E
MPVELVGRFPSAGTGAGTGAGAGAAQGEGPVEKVAEGKEPEGKGGCLRRLRRGFSCCCRGQSESGDAAVDAARPDATRPDTTPGNATDVDNGVGRVEEDGVKPPQPLIGDNELQDVSLQVRSVDLLKSQKEQNRAEHQTDQYLSDDLIIRRGQTFQVALDLSRPLNSDTDKLHLELKTGPRPLVSKGTHIIIPLVEELKGGQWQAKIMEQDGNRIRLSISSPPTALIGRYHLTVVTRGPKGVATTPEDLSNDIIMLFNPWCMDDTVYMDEEEERQEYVLNDTGRIYYGTEKQIGARTWNYGQFSEGVLAACLYILEKSDVLAPGRGDPVNVVRAITAMINSPDDRGVLEGNWSGDYAGGTAPTAWSGSVDILKKYHEEGGMPVKYGQCWVFSGVTTTVLRCLGVPARSVTNFQSAHDTDVSLTIDIYFNENMEALNSLNSDSVWNFHVWNDCWMARPDLPPGMGGWQAVDSTPQETSQGTFRCGPASVTAIRNGQVYHKHDTPFVFAEVNSDKIYWQRNLDGTFSQIHSEKKAVGHFISTKAVGSNMRDDITHLYKHPEGSEEERIAVETASRYGTKPNIYSAPMAEDVCMQVTMEGEGPCIGVDAQLTIVLRNQSSHPRSASLHSQVEVMYYTGVLKGTIKKDQFLVELMPNEVKTITWVLPYQNYQDQLVDQGALMLTLSGRVRETQQVLATQTSFRLRTPDINITPIGDAVVGKEMAAEICFKNPLPCPLKGVVFRVEGLGLQSIKEIPVGDVAGLSAVTLKEHFVPSLSGVRKLVASMHCPQLTQVHGVVDIVVQDN